jgi:hypothetical protein
VHGGCCEYALSWVETTRASASAARSQVPLYPEQALSCVNVTRLATSNTPASHIGALLLAQVGVSFDKRQEAIQNTNVGEPLLVVREPTNPVDRNAVAVRTIRGEHCGFVKKVRALGRSAAPPRVLSLQTRQDSRLAICNCAPTSVGG